MALRRFSSLRQRLDRVFLSGRLAGARSYRRIAGYFRSSIFELVGEEVESIPDVRIVCNSDLDARDILVARDARMRAGMLMEKWNEIPPESEALLNRESYSRLHAMLTRGNLKIRVVPRDRVFLHGKAGVIETGTGERICFLGSINETRSAFSANHEILWEDDSADGVSWVEEEFELLWKDGVDLPDAVIEEVGRLAEREEIALEDAHARDLPAAAFAESPLYRSGDQLQPWQRAFVVLFSEHRERYGKARLLLADEVGVGKTLSLAASGIVSAILDDGPVLILCPSTLTWQWQVELKDKLGIPSAVWSSSRKTWSDPEGHVVRTRGEEDIVKCPYRIAIVSTGLIFHNSKERDFLLRQRYGTVILDEAHKARRKGGLGADRDRPNNLLDFMLHVGHRTRHLLLGTATPIQTSAGELWDLLRILNSGADFVLGRANQTLWEDPESMIPIITGERRISDPREAWELLRCPLPPGSEHRLFDEIRNAIDARPSDSYSAEAFSSLPGDIREAILDELERSSAGPSFLEANNPVVRHTVLRQRRALEEMGLLKPVRVDIHPDPAVVAFAYPGTTFEDGLGLPTNHYFDLAYRAAEDFTRELRKRCNAAGFMKTLLLQRICSSFASGLSTARKLLAKEELDEEELDEEEAGTLASLTDAERDFLRIIADELSRPEARDPKLSAVKHFLAEHRVDGRTWLEHGCIIFSQYYDTASWVADELAKLLPDEPIAVYAGAGKSRINLGERSAVVEREAIKRGVREREIRLVVATDAACEGLNLQTLGTLINVDLPWNPSRLEQRLGRIKRFGQARDSVDMLNLVYHGTQDERVYGALSRRMKDRFDIFGSLPDTIRDEWIDEAADLEEELRIYWERRKDAQNAFQARYRDAIDPDSNRWELCSKVLSRRDVIDRLSEAW